MHGLQEFGGGYGDGGEKEFGEEGGGPEGVLEGGAGRAGGSGCEPYREMGSGEDQRDLPKGVEEVGEEEGCGRRRCKGEWEGVHLFLLLFETAGEFGDFFGVDLAAFD